MTTATPPPASAPPRPARAVLFDLDGTLVDSIGDLADAMNAVLARAGLPTHDREQYKRFVGEGVRVLVRRAVPEARRDGETLDRLVGEMLDEYRGCWDRSSRPYPGVAELLDALVARGLPLAILSNKVDELTRQVAERILARWSFAVVRGSLPDVPKKPDPTSALAVAEALGVEPASIVYLGDTAIDMRTAALTGMYGVGVLWGFRDEAELREGGARALIGHPRDLLSQVIDWAPRG